MLNYQRVSFAVTLGDHPQLLRGFQQQGLLTFADSIADKWFADREWMENGWKICTSFPSFPIEKKRRSVWESCPVPSGYLWRPSGYVKIANWKDPPSLSSVNQLFLWALSIPQPF